jgi:hypothetical protein
VDKIRRLVPCRMPALDPIAGLPRRALSRVAMCDPDELRQLFRATYVAEHNPWPARAKIAPSLLPIGAEPKTPTRPPGGARLRSVGGGAALP